MSSTEGPRRRARRGKGAGFSPMRFQEIPVDQAAERLGKLGWNLTEHDGTYTVEGEADGVRRRAEGWTLEQVSMFLVAREMGWPVEEADR
jgi:hypothetical protein